MPRYRLTIEYDGQPYKGFQAQESLPYLEFPMPEGVSARRYDPATGYLIPSGGAIGLSSSTNSMP